MRCAEEHEEGIVTFDLRGIWFILITHFRIKTRDKNKRRFDEKKAPVRILLPFKDQRSTNSVRRQLGELSRKIGTDIHPVYTSRKIGSKVKLREKKPPIVNQQCVGIPFQVQSVRCRLRMLTPVSTYWGREHAREQHGRDPSDIDLRLCGSARANLTVYDMLFIKDLKPTLNKQSDSVRAKLVL